MAILVTSGPRTGLTALGGGGWTAAGSYDQIGRFLRQTLGPEHALLFAEPSERVGAVDWYAEAPPGTPTVRFVDAAPDRREAARRVLDRLVADITARADALSASDQQADRITGEMLRFALEIPDEGSVWIVGGQPVLAFWGHRRDAAPPQAVRPLAGLIARKAASLPTPAPRPAPAIARPASGAIIPPPGPASTARAPARPAPWLARGLWGVLGLLLAGIGLMLLRGCALGLPALSGWLVDFCPAAPAAAGPSVALGAERARQATLQSELDGLQREAGLRRQYCELRPPRPEPRTEVPPGRRTDLAPPERRTPPPSSDGPVIPQKVNPDKPFDYAEGCWIAGENLVSTEDKEKKYPYTYKVCIDGQGYGQVIQDVSDGRSCRGPVQAQQTPDSLTFDIGESVCPKGPLLSKFVRNKIFCTRLPDGAADCMMKQERQPDVKLKLKREAARTP